MTNESLQALDFRLNNPSCLLILRETLEMLEPCNAVAFLDRRRVGVLVGCEVVEAAVVQHCPQRAVPRGDHGNNFRLLAIGVPPDAWRGDESELHRRRRTLFESAWGVPG